jgi:hypothetical protein
MTAPTTAAAALFIAAATSATATATVTTAATATLIAGPGFVDTEGTSLHLFPVQLGDGILSVGLRGHGDKRESTGLAREFILHEQHFSHSTGLREHVLQLELRGSEGQVAYVQSISHISLDSGFTEGCPSSAGGMSLKGNSTDPILLSR